AENGQNNENRRGSRPGFGDGNMPDFGNFDFGNMPDFGDMPSDFDFSDFDPSEMFGGDGKEGGPGGFGGGFGMGSSDVKLQYIDDDPDSYSNIFNNAKTTVNTADQKRLITALKALSEQTDLESTLDTDEVLRYFVVHNFLCNGDSYTGQMIHNYYLYEKNGQLCMIPWDYNLAYGSFMGGNASSSVNAAIDTPVSGDMSDRPMVAWIYDNADYTAQYHQLFSEFLDSVDFEAMITETAALIDKYVEKDPTKFCTYEEFKKGVEAIRTFCVLRAESVSGQLNGTIPSTSDGQKADSSALIDTGDLNISDMGSMGGAGGFGGFGGKSDRSGKKEGSEQTGTKSEQSDTQENDGQEKKPGRSGRRSGNDSDKQTGQSEMKVLAFHSGSVNTVQTLAARPDFGGGQPPQGFGGGEMPEGFDPGNMPEGFDPGNMPEGFDPGNMPEGFDPGNMPEGFDPGNMPEDFDPGNMPGGFSGKKDSDEANADSQSDSAQNEKPAGQDGNAQGSRPQPGGSGFPGMSGTAQTDHTTDYILLGVSALVLLVGLGFALKFKR
ncbi:MAG: CotH kinase family protein, partial [Oscillospiraceae bacterium]|nr:CotH kinase family protein [Oscillospiraceae bacterium]